MAVCKWCGEENADGVNVCSFCGQDMSVFEDSGIIKGITPASVEQSKARIPNVTSMNTGSINSSTGSINSGAARAAAGKTQQTQQKKTADYVTRNQLKQVAYQLDRKSRTLTILTSILAVLTAAAIGLGVLAFLRNNTKVDNSATESSIAQLQSKVSTLELELQSINAKLDELQEQRQTPAPVEADSSVVVKPDTDTETTPTEPDEPEPVTTTEPTTDTPTSTTPDTDTEIETTFAKVETDGTSIYAKVNQTFEGTTTYQWQKSPNLETWNNVNTSAAKTDTLKISVDDYLRNNAYRCRITNVDSKGVTSVYYTEIVDYNAYQIWSLIN